MTSDTLTITDNRTGKEYSLKIENDTINAMELRQIKVNEDDFGMMSYDPAYKNTASCKSTITFIDGAKGVLEYRGYSIEALAAKSSHLEVAYLMLNGALPNADELKAFEAEIVNNMVPHEGVREVSAALSRGAHPMAALQATIAALGTFHQDSADIADADNRAKHIKNLIAQIPTIAAMNYRHSKGLPTLYPSPKLGYAANFLAMLMSPGGELVEPDPILAKAMDVLFILHVDHEQNCSTSSMRAIGSSHVNPYSAVAGAIAALYGPLHGGANEAVLRMLREIGSIENVPAFIEKVKNREEKLMGFGHRVYRNYDPRAKEIKVLADQVFALVGKNPLIDIAVELERIALQDDFFVKRKLFPNVDFYSGLIYEAMAIPADFFTVLFAIARTVGWLSQWDEMLNDKEQKIARPRQVYLGDRGLSYKGIDER